MMWAAGFFQNDGTLAVPRKLDRKGRPGKPAADNHRSRFAHRGIRTRSCDAPVLGIGYAACPIKLPELRVVSPGRRVAAEEENNVR
jgi:hypothetical protein